MTIGTRIKINAILFFRCIESAYLEPVAEHADGGSELVIAREEPPLTMLIPILIAGAGIISFGVLSGKIISAIIQFALPAGF